MRITETLDKGEVVELALFLAADLEAVLLEPQMLTCAATFPYQAAKISSTTTEISNRVRGLRAQWAKRGC